MKLAEYLTQNGIKRIDFAAAIGATPGWITALCDETGWPSRAMAERIARETKGRVTPNDFANIDSAAESENAA